MSHKKRPVKEVAGRRMSSRTARKRSRRRKEIAQGRALVLACLGAAVLFYVVFLIVTIGDYRFAYGDHRPGYVSTTIMVSVGAILGIVLAVFAYRGHPVMRPLYLALNGIGAAVGMFLLATRYARDASDPWLLFDTYGVITTLLVLWVFYLSGHGQKFFNEQLMNVKRK